MLKIIAIGILGTVLAMVLKQVKPELALPVSLATGAIILIMAIPQALELMDGLKTMAGQFGMDGDMLKTVFKITAMAYILSLIHISIGHVEAGLRTNDKYSPFPEEMNRQMVGILADLHFAPTEQAKQNLLREGKPSSRIFVTGNTAIDALQTTVREDYQNNLLTWAEGSRLLVLTAHRRENLGEPMYRMFHAIRRILETHSDVKVIYPVPVSYTHLDVYKRQAQGISDDSRSF